MWLLGTSGVGKSTVGYRLLSALSASGVTAAFILRLDTAGRPTAALAGELVSAARAHLSRAAGRGEAGSGGERAMPRLLTITGPGGVGVSTVGFQTFAQLAKSSVPVGYLDTHQLGFLDGGHRLAELRARNAFSVAGTFAGKGAEVVVIGGDPATMRVLGERVESARVFWLHASPDALAERITSRAAGAGPPLQGDHRLGLAGADLTASIARAVDESRDLSLRPRGSAAIDTSSLTAGGAADVIVDASALVG